MTPSRFGRVLLLAPALLLALPKFAHAQVNTAHTAPLADDDASPDAVSHYTIETDLIAEKFDELERMAQQYRMEKATLPGGDWRLRLFYKALDAPQQTDKDTLDHLAHLEKWMKLRPESITPRIALCTSLHRWAWVARGGGMANTVTEDGWRLFNERIQESQAVLLGSQNMKDLDPQFYSEIMTVGLAQNWDQRRMQEAFERGVQLEPDYYYLYNEYANYLLPKWDGKPGDSGKFAKQSADRLGGDGGDILYFHIATVIVKRGNGRNFPVNDMDWPRIQRGAQALMAQYGKSRRIQNHLAFMAYKFNDAAVARQQFAIIGDRWSESVWKDRGFYDRIRDWAQGVASAS